MTAAKRWGPILCAFTGARVAEILQLRKQDIEFASKIAVLRIRPDAGTVKGRMYRDVPIHQQVIDLGFLDFVARAEEGPLPTDSAFDAAAMMHAEGQTDFSA